MEEQFVRDFLFPDSNTRRFHAGDACQWSPPVPEGEVSPETAAMIAAHRATIHAPGSRVRGRFGYDENGDPIETSHLGVGLDPETGETFALDAEGNRVGGSPAETTDVGRADVGGTATPAAPPTPTPAPSPATTTSTRTSTTSSTPTTTS